MNGIFWRALPIFAAAVAALNLVNALSWMHDDPEVHWVFPAVCEATSAATAIASIWIGWMAYRIAPADSRPIWRVAAVHAGGLMAFAAFHIGGFYLLRRMIFGILDLPFTYDLAGNFLYELRKDALGYAIGIAAFWAMTRIFGQPAATAEPPTFDIRDGARLVRVKLDEILVVTSAGNYVEFVLADGRKPLMRSPLAAIEAELAPRGFVRTHRSWLVNAARVTELRPERSGDYLVRLGALEAPLSRRFPEALAKLRG